MSEALAQVRAEFGSGAAVLHTREVNTGPIARLMRGRGVEVAATPDHSPLAAQAAESGAVIAAPVAASATATTISPKVTTTDPLLTAFGELVQVDIDQQLARQLLGSIDSESDSVHLEISQSLAARLSISGSLPLERGRRHISALVGPTGVGKTTTLAKLAANYRLHERARVGLITVDTYRVGAVEQLRTYADIIDLPMEVVATADEMSAACEKFSGFDLVLIDTAGRSPRDAEALEQLHSVVAAASPDETHLVLSATASGRVCSEALDRFATLAPTSVMLTKLDEVPTLGHMAAPLVSAKLPVSYLTDGQNVPEDIRTAELPSLVSLLLGRGAA